MSALSQQREGLLSDNVENIYNAFGADHFGKASGAYSSFIMYSGLTLNECKSICYLSSDYSAIDYVENNKQCNIVKMTTGECFTLKIFSLEMVNSFYFISFY